jgi:DNA-binding NarL/FixJ family response regulator
VWVGSELFSNAILPAEGILEQARCPVLVGRDGELQTLVRSVGSTGAEQTSFVLLMGEAGVGKTRLARELARRSSESGLTVMWGSCPQVELSLPYVPFLEAVGNYLAVADLPWVKRRLGPMTAELAELFPLLGAVVAPSADPVQARLRLFEALTVLLRATSRRAGLVLVIDDLHWADATTRELLDFVVRRLRGERVLILVSCRPETLTGGGPLAVVTNGWVRSGLASTVQLSPLSAMGVNQMVSAMLPGRHVNAHTRDLIFERSEGNPYVVEELVGALLDQSGSPRKDAVLDLPPTVREMVMQRVRQLSDAQARVLGLAAALGKSFDHETLVALAGGDEDEVDTALMLFRRLQLLDVEPGRDYRYHFRHELTRRVVYEELPRSARKRMHQRAADVLRELPSTPAVDLAYHLLQAGAGEQAIPFCIKAAEEAQRRGGYHEAADLYERVLPLLTDTMLRGHIQGAVGYVYLLQRDPGRALGHLAEGVKLLEAANQHVHAARYMLALGRCHWERSRPDLARAEYEAVRDRLEPLGPSEELAQAYVLLAGLADFDHDFAKALELARLAVAAATASGSGQSLIAANTRIGAALANMGHVAEGLDYMDRAYDEAMARQLYSNAESAIYNGIVVRWQNGLARQAVELIPRLRELQGERSQDLASFAEGTLLLLLGELPAAERALDAALARAQQAELSTLVRWIMIRIAWLQSVRGRPDLALRALPGREVQREQQEMLALRAVAMRVLLDAGRLEEALAEADVVLGPADWGVSPTRWWLHDAAVETLLQGGRSGDARRLAEKSLGDDPYQARIAGRVALAQGDGAQARARLMHAADTFAAMGYLIEEFPTRLDLARALAQSGRRRAAAVELQRVLDWAEAQGADRDAVAARRQLARLGPADRAEKARPGGLSRREWEIAELVAMGLSNRGIAARLSISERTAEGHVERIRNRLGCRSRAQIASWFTQHSYLGIGAAEPEKQVLST